MGRVAIRVGVALAVGSSVLAIGCAQGASAIAPELSPRAQEDLTAALDRARRAANVPGLSAAIVRGGTLLWSGGSGRAVRGRPGRPMVAQSLMPVASTTKAVVAAIALDLAEEGRVDLDRPIAAALPALPGASRITLRMLLSHRSGLADYFEDGYVERVAARNPAHVWTPGEVLARIDGLDFAPGRRFEYSNSGFVAAGPVIARAAGVSIEQAFLERIARPLGLSQASFRYRSRPASAFAHPHLVKGRGRWRDIAPGDGSVASDYWGETWTDGGLVATAPELALAFDGILGGRVLSAASLAQALPRGRRDYGLGLERSYWGGQTWIGHTGAYGGYETEVWRERASATTIAVFVNAEERPSDRQVASDVAWRAVARANRP